jgi:hypothetical protein
VWTGKQWGSLSFFFHVLTTYPQKDTLLSGKLLARQFLKGLCAPLRLADTAAQARGWHNALQKKCATKTVKKPPCEQNLSKESGTWD